MMWDVYHELYEKALGECGVLHGVNHSRGLYINASHEN